MKCTFKKIFRALSGQSTPSGAMEQGQLQHLSISLGDKMKDVMDFSSTLFVEEEMI